MRYVTPDNINTFRPGQQVHYLASPDNPDWRLEADATIIEISGTHEVLVRLDPNTIIAGPKIRDYVPRSLFDNQGQPPRTDVFARIPEQLTY